MTAISKWPEPIWLAELPPVERDKAKTRFYLCLAVISLGPKSTPASLSRALGLKGGAVNVMKTRGHVSVKNAIAIENLIGRDLFPREIFRPELTLPE